jgi:hypothetical protein
MKIKNKTEVLENTEKTNQSSIKKKWNKQLDDYKNYRQECLKHYKKAQKGNEVSLAIYPYLKVKWEVLNQRLNSAAKKNILNEKQMNKISKIQSKIVGIHNE